MQRRTPPSPSTAASRAESAALLAQYFSTRMTCIKYVCSESRSGALTAAAFHTPTLSKRERTAQRQSFLGSAWFASQGEADYADTIFVTWIVLLAMSSVPVTSTFFPSYFFASS